MASARAAAGPARPRQHVPVEAIGGRCFDQFPKTVFYDCLDKRGFNYGPAFRGLTDVRCRKGEALGALSGEGMDARGHAWHPALLDACFHAVAAAFGAKELLDEESDAFFLPVSVDRIAVYGKPDRSSWSHCSIVDRDSNTASSNLVVTDRAGSALMELVGLRLRGSRAAIRKKNALNSALTQWLYDTTWIAKRAEEPGADAGAVNKNVAILSDDGGIAEALALELAELGVDSVLVKKSDTYADEGGMEDIAWTRNRGPTSAACSAPIPRITGRRSSIFGRRTAPWMTRATAMRWRATPRRSPTSFRRWRRRASSAGRV